MEKNIKISIIASRFSPEIVDNMVESALAEAADMNLEVIRTVRVPGAYEMPLALKTVLEKKDSDAIVVLGFIEAGETLHGEIMGHVSHSQFVRLSLEYNVPLGIGTIGPGASHENAATRWDSYARAAVKAAVSVVEDIKI